MRLTKTQRHQAYQVVAETACGTFCREDSQLDLIVEATLAEFNRQVRIEPTSPPIKSEAEAAVKEQVKGALPFLAVIFIGWAIGKLLDWLWDRYTARALEAYAAKNRTRSRGRHGKR